MEKSTNGRDESMGESLVVGARNEITIAEPAPSDVICRYLMIECLNEIQDCETKSEKRRWIETMSKLVDQEAKLTQHARTMIGLRDIDAEISNENSIWARAERMMRDEEHDGSEAEPGQEAPDGEG